MTRLDADICVIGAGAGGLSVAAGAARMGARVVLVEGNKMGGDCLNHGCVPSKALISVAAHAQALRVPGAAVAPVRPEVDYAAAMDHVARAIAAIAPIDSQERFEGLGVTVIRDWGRFVSPTELQAGDHIVKARRFVVATGSRPFVPPIDGLDRVPYLTNETIFDLRERPEHLIIIGGGPIGIEMAQAHARLGSRVTVIEAAKALGREDRDLAEVALARLRAEGVTILDGVTADRISGGPGVSVHTARGEITGSHLLIAIGRQVDLERLALDKAGVAHDRRGVTVGPGLRSVSNRRVHAVGDAAGGLQFTHLAGYHAGIVIRSALLGLPARARTDHIPRVTYSDPEIAHVGLGEDEARARFGDRLTVIRQHFADNDRAITSGRTDGMIKLLVVRGRPVGVGIVGAGAGELIGIWALALANRLRLSAIANTVLPYPTLAEINKRAASAYFSPKLFESPMVKRVVSLVQQWIA